MFEYFLFGLFFISCLVLIATVLLQPGKTDAGALFTSNISSTAFGPRGTQSLLSKITIAAAALFMLSALLLSLQAVRGGGSVLSTVPEVKTETTVTPTSNTANSNSANTVTNTDSNVGNSNASNSTPNPNQNK